MWKKVSRGVEGVEGSGAYPTLEAFDAGTRNQALRPEIKATVIDERSAARGFGHSVSHTSNLLDFHRAEIFDRTGGVRLPLDAALPWRVVSPLVVTRPRSPG